MAVVESILHQVRQVIVVDNGGDQPTRTSLTQLTGRFPEKVKVIWNPKNLGIAGGLNIGVREALEKNFPWILTLDHDSIVPPGMLDALLDVLDRYPEPDKVGILAPRYSDPRTKKEGLYTHYGKGWRNRSFLRFEENGSEYLEPTEVIASGNLVRGDLFRLIGLFDERLFIDYVDVDFCLRTASAGYRILVARDAMLQHEIGSPVVHMAKGKEIPIANYSPARRYFISRNRIFLMRKYGRAFPSFFLSSIGWYVYEFLFLLRYESGRPGKLALGVRGIIDGLAGRMGNPFRDAIDS